MDLAEAVDKAPPGWRHFTTDDIARLPASVRRHEMARVPPGETPDRVLKFLFWTLVYHLAPEMWDELASFEPIHPALLDALPARASTALDVGAGSGRLTQHLVARSRRVIAVEPSSGLLGALTRRLPEVRGVEGWAEALPIRGGTAELTTVCGAFGPDPAILSELKRVTAPGGLIVMVSPEQPEWFEANGWRRISAPAITPPPHPSRIDEFFGPLDPPHEMVILKVEA